MPGDPRPPAFDVGPTWTARYAAALERWDQAKKAAWRARAEHRPDAGELARAEAERLGDVGAVRQAMVSDLFEMIRQAARGPTASAFRELLAELLGVNEPIRQLQADVQELAGAVVELKATVGPETLGV